MAETKNTPETGEELDKNTVVFHKPYTFEDTEYKEITLSEFESLTAEDMFKAEAYARRKLGVAAPTVIEQTTPYLLYIAARSAQLPIEFMEGLPNRDVMAVKYIAWRFFD